MFSYLSETISIEHRRTAFYQTKLDTRVDGAWEDTMELEVIPPTRQLDYFRGLPLRPYQIELHNKSTTFDMRVIDLIYDPNGNIGKSLFLEWLEQ